MTVAINRRDFLKLGGAALAAAAFPFGTSAAPSGGRRIRKAISYGSIWVEGTDFDRLRAVKDAGFEGVELSNRLFVAGIIPAMLEVDLKVAGLQCATYDNRRFSDADEERRAYAYSGLWQALRDAGRYGHLPVRIDIGPVTKDATYKDCFKWTVQGLKDAVDMAEAQGVKLAVENSVGGFITKPEQALELLKEVDSPLVGWHFNPAAAARHGAPEAWVTALGKHILNLQVPATGKPKPAEKNSGTPKAAEGNSEKPKSAHETSKDVEFNWQRVVKALGNVQFQGWAICELPSGQWADAEALKKLSEWMDRILVG